MYYLGVRYVVNRKVLIGFLAREMNGNRSSDHSKEQADDSLIKFKMADLQLDTQNGNNQEGGPIAYEVYNLGHLGARDHCSCRVTIGNLNQFFKRQKLPNRMVKGGHATPQSTGNKEANPLEEEEKTFNQSPTVPGNMGTQASQTFPEKQTGHIRKKRNVGR
ncbi:hypothetical protein NPIL_623281 [Nephila pilipes]|uniref:Uncharacterized protein n=1 Tax=Nephila pilipes TaxID=299642 RepID=A0A8X6R4S2_NEPPI|nr:hypothetical protein NPIL_623281 [Nephila pilipes]